MNRIGHDNTGVGPGWHLKEVIIESIDLGKKWIFPCNRWLDKNEGDGRIDVELTPLKSTDFDTKGLHWIRLYAFKNGTCSFS